MFIDYLISTILALIMFTIGSTLKPDNFIYLARHPRQVVIGLILQMIYLPILAFALIFWLPIDPIFKVGIMVLSLCPGGTTANLISFLVQAEVSLSIALTSINSFLILVTVPLFTYLSLSFFTGQDTHIHLPAGETILNIVLIVLLPVVLGMLFFRYFPKWSVIIRRPLKWTTITLLAVMFLIKFFAPDTSGGSGIIWSEIIELFPIVLIIHLLAMIVSYWVAKRLNISHKSSVTIGIEVGLQNTTLALLITSSLLKNEQMAKPALVYALFSFFTTFGFGWLNMRKKAISKIENR